MSMDEILVEDRDRVRYITLNRPEKLNALNTYILETLPSIVNDAMNDPGVGAIVLTGAGRGFCAGGDLSPREGQAEVTIGQSAEHLRAEEESSRLLYEGPKVAIASINGPVAGAGLSLALACDIRIASDTARFTTAFSKVGFSGDFGGSYLLTQLVGSGKARELYFLSDQFDAAEALRLGVVNRVVPGGLLAEETDKIARRIAHGPLVAYKYIKDNMNTALKADLATVLDREAHHMSLTARTADHREAVKAFFEKRQPAYKGE